MELNYFRDRLFDLLNDSEGLSKSHRRRFFYRVSGWNSPDSSQGTKSPRNANRGSLLLLKTNYQQSMKNKYRQRPLLQYNRNGNKSASAGGTF